MARDRTGPCGGSGARCSDTRAGIASSRRGGQCHVRALRIGRAHAIQQAVDGSGAGWLFPEDQRASEERAATRAWQTCLRALVAEMRNSRDADSQAATVLAISTIGQFSAASSAVAPGGGTTPDANLTEDLANAGAARAPSDLVHAYPDRSLVQWLAAASGRLKVAARADAIGNLQRLEPDNAAAWALLLDSAVDDSAALRRAAASVRFDSHTSELLRVWLDALAAHPLPPECADQPRSENEFAEVSNRVAQG